MEIGERKRRTHQTGGIGRKREEGIERDARTCFSFSYNVEHSFSFVKISRNGFLNI